MAAAPQANRSQREVIEFAPNVPVTVALKYAQSRTVSGQNGERAMFSTSDGRVMFLDLSVAAKIEALGINVGESFLIVKRTDGKRGSPVSWEVSRPIGEQADGTFAVPKLPEPKPVQRANASSHLAAEAIAVVDAYAEVLQHALTRHEGRIKPDEVRALFISSYIQRNSNGRAA